MTTALVIISALILDRLLGEPNRFHPLVGFGNLASHIERVLNKSDRSERHRYALGIVAVTLLCGGFTLLSITFSQFPYSYVIEALLLYLVIAPRSLAEHATQVYDALHLGNLEHARLRVSYMVSRETTQMDENQISKATIESTLENGNDAIFGALFWFAVAGIPGAICFRLANTLDAMWGYRTERFNAFGWCAARFDDLLNYIPARLTALSYGLVGHLSTALHCWRHQGHLMHSPNAGPVMCAGAGALGIALGGNAIYHGKEEQRPVIGQGEEPKAEDISAAIQLVQRSILLWVVVIAVGGWIIA